MKSARKNSSNSMGPYKVFFGFVMFAASAFLVVMSAQVINKNLSKSRDSQASTISKFSQIGVANTNVIYTNFFPQTWTNQKLGYFVRINPEYTGETQVLFNGKVSRWYNANNGWIKVTPNIMASVSPGIYPMRLRPNCFTINQSESQCPWSNQATVVVRDANGYAPGLDVKVSVDGKTYTESITTTLDQGYYLKVYPIYEGMLEGQVRGGKAVKWLATDKNGIVRVTREIMKNGTNTFSASKANTTYVSTFRPYMDDSNIFPNSKPVTVIVK